MKQPIPFTGTVLITLAVGLMLYLAIFTNLLVPKQMKEKSRSNQFNYEEGIQNEQDDFDPNYTDVASMNPLFDDEIDLSNWQVSKPASFKNLSVCLIYGKTDLDRKKYVTLNTALKQRMVVVHETQEVNTLTLDNNSDNYIYINSGEIVKGGQQDRTIQYDVVIAPHDMNVDLASFCVESSRWSARGNENVYAFETSDKMVSNTSLKIATKHDKNQSEVWSEVSKYQEQTEMSVNDAVAYTTPVVIRDEQSESSLELTLENDEIEKLQEEYKTAIRQQLDSRKDVTGFAYFINGKLYGIDVFNNHQLFADLFSKLLDAAIAEAISVYDKKAKLQLVSESTVSLLLIANAKVYQDETVNAETQFRTSQHNSAKNVLIFTSFDRKEKSWLHRNWLEDTGNGSVNMDIPMNNEFEGPVQHEQNEYNLNEVNAED